MVGLTDGVSEGIEDRTTDGEGAGVGTDDGMPECFVVSDSVE